MPFKMSMIDDFSRHSFYVWEYFLQNAIIGNILERCKTKLVLEEVICTIGMLITGCRKNGSWLNIVS